ncbi:hypothetical protein IVB57_20170 [Bradyrhizobium sp. CW9]|uniref:hypothetical protein n=1 Tax=Bradyrhizobium sp. CW9 TaxID=2782689 RepID=UPI001FFA4BC4|nr:hypothetical protein [Bradyrhizobium sp. CW9]MCK1330642.1 hypothetical protein [Bradyrhizobium sp. CW9]
MANQYKTRTKTSARAELSTRTATSRPKLAKTDVKRSPPVKDTKQQSAGVGMLALFRDLWMTFKHKVNFDSGDGGAAEYKGTYEVMRSMSFIRPVTAMEALAQAVFIQNEMCDPGNSPDERVELSERIVRRAAGLVLWIEETHGIDRRELGLEDFCHIHMKDGLFPDAPLESRPEARMAARAVAPAQPAEGAE